MQHRCHFHRLTFMLKKRDYENGITIFFNHFSSFFRKESMECNCMNNAIAKSWKIVNWNWEVRGDQSSSFAFLFYFCIGWHEDAATCRCSIPEWIKNRAGRMIFSTFNHLLWLGDCFAAGSAARLFHFPPKIDWCSFSPLRNFGAVNFLPQDGFLRLWIKFIKFHQHPKVFFFSFIYLFFEYCKMSNGKSCSRFYYFFSRKSDNNHKSPWGVTHNRCFIP